VTPNRQFTTQLQPHRSTIKVNWVICQNNVRSCVKGECDVCACAKSRDLLVGDQKQLHFWNVRPYSLYKFYGATITIKGRLYNTCRNVKGVFEPKFLSTAKKGPQNGGFGGKKGLKLNFWFCNPQKAHPCREPRLLTYFASKSVWASRL